MSSIVTEVKDRISVPVYNRDGVEVSKIEIDPQALGGKINRQVLHDVVVMYLANQRSGTASTKRRGEVAGSTKKLFRQKGTGNARAGTRRTNKRRGGGTAKGPKPRDYEFHLPKKVVRAATKMALLSKFLDKEAIVVEDFNLPTVDTANGGKLIKTKEMAGLFKRLKLDEKTCLIGTHGLDQNVYRSARNLPGVEVLPTAQFNAYALLRPKRLLISKAALEELLKPKEEPKEETKS